MDPADPIIFFYLLTFLHRFSLNLYRTLVFLVDQLLDFTGSCYATAGKCTEILLPHCDRSGPWQSASRVTRPTEEVIHNSLRFYACSSAKLLNYGSFNEYCNFSYWSLYYTRYNINMHILKTIVFSSLILECYMKKCMNSSWFRI